MHVLVVSSSENSATVFKELLSKFDISSLKITPSGKTARQILIDQDFDLIIINSPIKDETGERFVVEISQNFYGQMILIVKNEHFEEISVKTEDYGVITLAKPINKAIFWSAIKVAKATNARLNLFREKNKKLTRQIDDIKYIDRAKCILISSLNMSEKDAHKYIEKQAMDSRTSKREVAEKILRTYEN